MYTCPACQRRVAAEAPKCPCGADLSLLQAVDALPDAWFNRALQELSAGRVGRALEWAAAACAARPDDAEALRLLAGLWVRLGRWDEAQDALDRAEALAPGGEDTQRLERTIRTGRRLQTHRPRPRAGRRRRCPSR